MDHPNGQLEIHSRPEYFSANCRAYVNIPRSTTPPIRQPRFQTILGLLDSYTSATSPKPHFAEHFMRRYDVGSWGVLFLEMMYCGWRRMRGRPRAGKTLHRSASGLRWRAIRQSFGGSAKAAGQSHIRSRSTWPSRRSSVLARVASFHANMGWVCC